jgi:hypothetical protein
MVLRTVPGEDPPGTALACDEVERRIERKRTTRTRRAATTLIAQRHSSEATQASEDDFDALARESEQALEHVAFGRRRRARQAVRKILRRAQGALETLNREARSARRVLNSCLYLVRALAEGGNERAGLEQAVECARLVPDMTPSASEHPPHVRALFEQAKARIENGPHGSLRVESHPETGCDVYLNGRRLGQTPFEREELPTGEYRVQVECDETGRAGRVHRLILSAEPRELVIDTRFDTTLRTSAGDLRHEYEDPEAEKRYRIEHAMQVSRIVGATDVLLVTPEEQAVRVDHLRVPRGRVVASVRLPRTSAGVERDIVRRGVRHLLAGRSVDLTGPVERELDTWQPPERARLAEASSRESAGGATRVDAATGSKGAESAASPSDTSGVSRTIETGVAGTDPSRGAFEPTWVGWTLVGAGAGAFIAAWGLQAEWFNRHDRVQVAQPTDADYLQRVDQRNALKVPVATVGAAGAALATGSLPWIVQRNGPRWWHWTLGVAGLGGVAAGAGLWTLEGSCANDECTTLRRRVPLGPLVMLTSIPFVAVPVVAWLVEQDEQPSDAATDIANTQVIPSLGPRGASITLRRVF